MTAPPLLCSIRARRAAFVAICLCVSLGTATTIATAADDPAPACVASTGADGVAGCETPPAPLAADPQPPAPAVAPAEQPAEAPGPVADPAPAGAQESAAAEPLPTDGTPAPPAIEQLETEGHPTHTPPPASTGAPEPQGPEAVHHPHRVGGAATDSRQTSGEPERYYPPIAVDWSALTPLAPPEFGAGAARSFPGPLFLLPIYQAAAADYDVPWQILASINEIETDFGRNVARSSAGAVGWMQFLPSSWDHYGRDVNGDGVANPNDPVDAIFAAARYLHIAGSLEDLGRALFAYNHANWYVAKVLRRAVELGSIPQDLLTTLTERGRTEAATALHRADGSANGLIEPGAEPYGIGQAMLLSDQALQAAVLDDQRVEIYGCGRLDIGSGQIDRRVLETIEYLADDDLHPTISSLHCGHGFFTSSGNVSEHSSGDALDISRINGTAILGNQGRGSITDRTIQELLKLQGAMRPHQIISLMTFQGASNTLALGDHDDHIHVGFAPLRGIAG